MMLDTSALDVAGERREKEVNQTLRINYRMLV